MVTSEFLRGDYLKKQHQSLEKVQEKIYSLLKKGDVENIVFITFLDAPFYSNEEQVGRLYVTRVLKKKSFTSCFRRKNVAFDFSSCIISITKQLE